MTVGGSKPGMMSMDTLTKHGERKVGAKHLTTGIAMPGPAEQRHLAT